MKVNRIVNTIVINNPTNFETPIVSFAIIKIIIETNKAINGVVIFSIASKITATVPSNDSVTFFC